MPCSDSRRPLCKSCSELSVTSQSDPAKPRSYSSCIRPADASCLLSSQQCNAHFLSPFRFTARVRNAAQRPSTTICRPLYHSSSSTHWPARRPARGFKRSAAYVLVSVVLHATRFKASRGPIPGDVRELNVRCSCASPRHTSTNIRC